MNGEKLIFTLFAFSLIKIGPLDKLQYISSISPLFKHIFTLKLNSCLLKNRNVGK